MPTQTELPEGKARASYQDNMTVGDQAKIEVEVTTREELSDIGGYSAWPPEVVGSVEGAPPHKPALREVNVTIYPFMGAELVAPAFEIVQSPSNSERIQAINQTRPAKWTWYIRALRPDEESPQQVTVKFYGYGYAELGGTHLPTFAGDIVLPVSVSDRPWFAGLLEKLRNDLPTIFTTIFGTSGLVGALALFLQRKSSQAIKRVEARVDKYHPPEDLPEKPPAQ